jgi:hypothetical protein
MIGARQHGQLRSRAISTRGSTNTSIELRNYSQPSAKDGWPSSSAELVDIEATIRAATARHNSFLKELGLPALP